MKQARGRSALFISVLLSLAHAQPPIISNQQVEGYQGIWFDLGQRSKHGSKYSGGLGTYTAKHVPLAIYAPEAHRTFFVYGGSRNAKRHLLCMAGCFDHHTGKLSKPTLVHDKGGVDDPHDNPSISMDRRGHIWIFVSGRARKRMGYRYRSLKPHSIEAFEQVAEQEMTYPQPWWVKDRGFLLLYTQYTRGRELYWHTSADGLSWTSPRKLAGMGGHYQTSRQHAGRVITAFNMHPQGNVDKRTNLYYLQSDDGGQTWETVGGTPLPTPLEDPQCAALVRDYQSEKRLVYLKDITFDRKGRPVILIITSAHYQPGPPGDPRWWTLVHWTGSRWTTSEITRASHNYDQGSMAIEPDGTWRIIAPTERGPQPFGTGGEVALWISRDRGATWTKQRDITRHSARNHAYCRIPIQAHPDFYAFWADGNPDRFSRSALYFTNKSGDTVWQMPSTMRDDWEEPARVAFSP